MERLNGRVAVAIFAALTAVVALQVLNRVALHLPIIWSEEVARFLFLWVVMLGAALSVKRRRHFVLVVLPRRIGTQRGPLAFLVDMVPDACVLGFALFLFVQGIIYVRAGTLRTGTNSEINMALVYAAIPVFAVLSVIYSIRNLVADYRAWRVGAEIRPTPPPAE